MNPEQDFLAWIERRDAEALGRVFDATAGRLLLLAAHLAGPDGADDLVQATFLKAMTRGRAWDRARPLWPWLAGILHHEAGMRWRQRERRREVGLEAALEKTGEAPGPLREAVSAEAFEALQHTIDELPMVYRQVLRLRIVHDLQPIEIARALELPVGTVRSQLHRGLERLRERLPRGVAGLVGVMVLDDGAALAAMRAKIVAEANALAGVGAGAGVVGWALWTAGAAMKGKWLVSSAVAAVLLVGLLWTALAPWGLGGAAVPVEAGRPRVADSTDEQADSVERSASASERQEVVEVGSEEVWDLTVHVTGPEERPRAGVPVRVWFAARGGSVWDGRQGASLREDLAEGVTSTDGIFHCNLEALRDRSSLVFATSFVFVAAAQCTGEQAVLAVPRGPGPHRLIADIELDGTQGVTGRVVDAFGSPVEDAELWWREVWDGSSEARLEQEYERSDAEGRFRLALPANPELRAVGLVVHSVRHGIAEVELPGEEDLGGADDDLDLGEIRLAPRAAIRGRAVLRDGLPLARFPVHVRAVDPARAGDPADLVGSFYEDGGRVEKLRLAEGHPVSMQASVASEDDGSFAFSGLDPAATYAVYVRDSSLHRFGDCMAVVHPGDDPFTLRVNRHLLVLDVRSERGDLLPGIGLRAEGTDPERAVQMPGMARPYTVRNAAFYGGLDGHLFLLSPFGWTWRIATGDEGAIADVLHHEAIEGLHRAERTLQLRPETRFGALRLAVVDDAGEPLNSYGYTVRCADREIERRSMMPPADGLLGDLPAGRWTLTLRLGEQLHYGWWGSGPGARGSATVDCEVVDGEVVEVPVVAPPMGRVVLRIQVGSGESPPGTVRIRNEADGSVQGFELTARLEAMAGGTLADRVHLLRNAFPPGRHVFVVTADGYAAARCVVDVVADRATEAAVGLAPL